MKNFLKFSIEIMNKLKYFQKFVLIAASIVILTIGIIYLLLSNLQSQADFSQKEVHGIKYINPLRNMLYQMQESRDSQSKGLSVDNAELNKYIALTDEADKSFNAILSVKDDWKKIKEEWKSANDFDKQTEVINKVIALISHINDTSNLVLDPDLDTYYLMDAYSLKLPNIMEKLNIAKRFGEKSILAGTDNKKELIQLSTLIDEINELLKGGLDVIYNFNPDTKAVLDEPFNAAYNSNKEFLDAINKIIAGENMSLAAFTTLANNAHNKNMKLYDTYAKEEEHLISKRVKKYVDQMPVAVGFTLFVLAIIAYLFGGFYYSIMDSLKVLEKNALKVADGDLTVHIKLNAQDEMSDLANIFNKMTENLKGLVAKVSHSAQEIAAGSQEMNAAVEQTAQGAEQVSSSVEQLAIGTQQVSENIETGASSISTLNTVLQTVCQVAQEVAKLGNETENNAVSGKDEVRKAVDKIGSIKKSSGDISKIISHLGGLSSEIEEIVDLIKNIANQTNLLALNAAIEAARAGEHGKGFAVVADEVKKLAEQSSGATDKITEMIKEIQSNTNTAVISMDKASQEVEEGVVVISQTGNVLSDIIEQVKNANVKIQEINVEIEDVAKNSDELVRMIENISAVTEETAASSEEITSITEEQTASLQEINASSNMLAKIAENLQTQILQFKI